MKLSRLAFLSGAQEATPNTYQAPTFTIPFLKGDYETTQAPQRDESIRGNDAVLQGVYPGPAESSFSIDSYAYTDILGQWLRMIGPDTVVAATTTTIGVATTVGATSISIGVALPTGTVIRIDTAAAIEYAITGVQTGTGPFVTPLVSTPGGSALALTKTHSVGAAVTTTTKHTFAQSTTVSTPRWSLSLWDTNQYLGFPGCGMSELAIKIDPKATVQLSPKFTGFPEQVVTAWSPAYNTGVNGPSQPLLGWGWSLTDAGGASTRGLTLDLTLKRSAEAIHPSNGVQAPREVFVGALELDGTLKVIYENIVDKNLFLNWQQLPVTAALAKAIQFGGESLSITASQTAAPKWKGDLGQPYVEASVDLSAIYNTTDNGICTATLNNWQTTAY